MSRTYQIFVIKCVFAVTGINLEIREKTALKAIEKAKRDPIGKKALEYVCLYSYPAP